MPKKKEEKPLHKKGVVNAEEGEATQAIRKGYQRFQRGAPNKVRNVRSS